MQNNHINYIEFKAKDIENIKKFYNESFGWEFKDYGPDYASFKESGIFGGFQKTEGEIINGTLIILYHKDLEAIKKKIIQKGATISQEIFSFPGGRRFHFKDPSGNELGIWSDK